MAGSVMSPNYVPQTSHRQLGLGALRGLLDVTPVGIADAVQSGINNMQSPVGAALRSVTGKAASPGDVLLGKLGLLGSGSGYDAGRFALNAAFPAMGLLGNQAGGALPKGYARNQSGAIVWHGSPHKFDRFDASKIGTGEGAQAYGHGLYLAENPSVATSYKELVQRDPARLAVDGKLVPPDTMYGRAAEDVARIGLKAAIQKIDDNIRFNNKYAPDMAALYKDLRAKIETLEPSRVSLKEGSLYKVDLPDDQIAKMLDWDKPLSQQSAQVQAAIGLDKNPNASIKDMTGLEFYVGTGGKLGEPTSSSRAAAEHLRKKGISGIRYLDGGSRGTGSGTSNFVVFPGNEGLLNILERNGQPIR
jgi:hypothetical protein